MHVIRLGRLGGVALFIALLSSGTGHRAAAQALPRPGDDFFAFANDAWLRENPIPPGRESWTARTEIAERTRRQTAALLADTSAPAGTLARKVADFRAAWLDERAIERRGLASVRPLLDSIARAGDRPALARLLGRALGADVDPLNWGIYQSSHVIGLSVEPGIHGEKRYRAFLVQGGLGLPDREYYVSAEPRMEAVRARYRTHVERMLALAGFDRAGARAAAVMTLETALARGEATREASANDHNADSVWARADFASRAPGLDWPAFFAAAGLTRQDSVVVWQPTAVRALSALAASEPIAAWKDYLAFHALDALADVLPRALADEALAFRAAGSGDTVRRTREQRALEATQSSLAGLIGQLYAARYFPPAEKARVRRIVDDVAAAFIRRVEASTWMAPETRARALAKLHRLYIGIGYPDRWEDYSDLVVDVRDAAGNLRRVNARNRRRALDRLGQPVDLTEWWIGPERAGAILIFQQNAYDFTAALLQPPKYDPAASDAANYGAIGAIIGHDISHYVDLLGAEYDTDGAMRHWWTADDMTRFLALAQPLVDQFSAYEPLSGTRVNGKSSLTENVADLAGLAAALDAWHATLGAKAADRDYVREQDRQFFIGYARSWRGRLTDGALRTQLAGDIHAPDRYRVATVRNLDAWYDAFGVEPGQALYLAPAARVRIW